MNHLAAQLYTCRAFLQDEKNFAETCRKIKAIGYDAIQLSGHSPSLSGKYIQEVCAGEGLKIIATHYGMDYMEKNFSEFVSNHQLWGCPNAAIGGFFPPVAEWTNAKMDAFLARFNAIAERMHDAWPAFRLGYHNHSHEFARFNDGTPLLPFERLLRGLGNHTWFEIDTFWVAAGGTSPATAIRRVAGRIPCVHLKDMQFFRKPNEQGSQDLQRKMCEVGDGNLDWPEILEACRYAGVQWYIVERDDGDLEPFASLARSFENLRNKFGMSE